MKKFAFSLILALILLTCQIALADSTLTLPASLMSIQDEAFMNDTSFDAVILPEGIESIGARAFAGCAFEEIILPDGLTYIADDAFEGSGLVKVTATEGTYAYSWALEEGYIKDRMPTPADYFTTEILVDGTLSIVGYTGEDTVVVVPSEIYGKRVTKIGDYAFEDCNSLMGIDLPDSVTSIGEGAFSDCDSLTSIDLPDGVTSIGSSAFSDCDSLTGVTIPDSVSSIGQCAFLDCYSLDILKLPDNISSIGEGGVGNYVGGDQLYRPLIICNRNSITAKAVSGTADRYVATRSAFTSPGEEDFLYRWDNDDLILVGYLGKSLDVTVPDYVDGLGRSAFTTNLSNRIQSIKLNSRIDCIPDHCFSGCNLKEIILPENVKTIEYGAFDRCESLSRVVMLHTVTSIDNDAFYYCFDVFAVVESGSYAESYCIEHEIPHEVLRPLSARAYWTTENTHPFSSIGANVEVDGGLKPYQYKFTFYKGNEELYSTDWSSKATMSFVPTEEENYKFTVTVKDSLENTIMALSGFMYTHEPTQEEVEESERKAFYLEMKSLFEDVKWPDQSEGYAYYKSYPDEWAWYQQWISLLSGEFTDADTYVAEREWLYYNAMKMATTGDPVKLVGGFSLPSAVETIDSTLALTESSMIDTLYEWAGGVNKSFISRDDFEELFKKLNSGEIDELEASDKLSDLGVSRDIMQDFFDKMNLMSIINLVPQIVKTLKTTDKVFNYTKDVLNQYVILNSLDMNQLYVIAESYMNRGSAAQQDVGRILMEFAVASREEQLLMIICGKGAAIGLDALADGALSAVEGWLSASTPIAMYKLTVSAIDTLTGIKSLPVKFHELNYATGNTQHCWNEFRVKQASYLSNPSDEAFIGTYHALLNYYEAVALSDEAFVTLVDSSKEAWLSDLYIGEPLRVASTRAQVNVQILHEMCNEMREIYALWNSDDYSGARDALAIMIRDYGGYNFLGAR